jgi:hypothetical protein
MAHRSKLGAGTRNRLLDEHRTILRLAAQLGGVAGSEAMLRALDRLQPLLERHFREEEVQDGLFDAIRRHTPEREMAIAALSREHKAMLASVQLLRDLAAMATAVEVLQSHGAALRDPAAAARSARVRGLPRLGVERHRRGRLSGRRDALLAVRYRRRREPTRAWLSAIRSSSAAQSIRRPSSQTPIQPFDPT